MGNRFMGNALKGFSAKLITEAIFRDSNYESYPFGYESTFSRLIGNIDLKSQDTTTLQLRCMPDLLVYDHINQSVFLVECKFRNAPALNNIRFSKKRLEKYKEYWKGSILVLIVPTGDLLYAQYIEKLNLNSNRVTGDNIYFDVSKDFVPFNGIFPRTDSKIIKKYKTFIETLSDSDD